MHPVTTSRRESTSPAARARRAELTEELWRQIDAADDGAEQDDLIEQIVLANRGVAETIARRYHHRGIDDEDLNQVACEALIKAVRRFDPDRHKDLLAYAVPTIRGELQRHFRDHGWVVRPTRSVQEAQWRITRAEERLAQEIGRPPTRDEVCAELEIGREEYDEAMAASGCFRPSSLDQPMDEDGATSLGDLLPDDDREQEALEAQLTLAPVLRTLSDRDRRLLHLRFHEDLTQAEIGAELGVTQTQVSRLLTGVLDELRRQLV